MKQERGLVKEFIDLYHQFDTISKYHGAEAVFKLTRKGAQSLTDLSMPNSERTFRELIENLYILVYEGSGNGERLPVKLDDKKIVQKIKLFRNHYVHDPDKGNQSEVRRKYRQIGDFFQEYIGTRAPSREELWSLAGKEVLVRLNKLLNLLIEHFPNYNDLFEKQESKIEHYFEHEITKFPEERIPYIEIEKKGTLRPLARAPIFIPHFSLSWPPEFGMDSKHAIHFSSRAYNASLENYKKFLKKIESLWEKNMYYLARDTRNLISWSISSDGKLKYGSGFPNLLKAIKDTVIGMVTIFLIGCYGEDYSKTFFVIISNYWKGGRFRDNTLDLYLSNMPLNYGWVEEFNETMKILSNNTNIANSYSLKPYFSRKWRSEKRYTIKNKIIGGVGRDGYDDDRHWDQFVGLILENPFTAKDFKLEEAESTLEYSKESIKCPVDAFDKIVMSVTNTPPDVEAILSGKFYGVANPIFQEMIFDGYGHEIHAILVWGVSLLERDKEVKD